MTKRSTLILCALSVLLLLCQSAALAQSAPAWQAGTTYAVGALVTFNGQTFQCIQGHTALAGWEPPNVPALWKPVAGGGGGGCTTAPSVPTGLAASNVTSSSATLSWNAATAASGCTVSSYTVFQNGSAIGTTAGTTFTVNGLAASTMFSFTVAATDAAGTSTPSGAVSVTTQAGGGGNGGGCAPAWSATQTYTGGMTVNVNGINYKANFFSQNQNPVNNNGPQGSGQPWTSLGPCQACSTVPSVPTGLAASNTTANTTNLTWTASTAASNCTVTGYTVFQNGAAIGTTTTPSFFVTGLAPQTTFKFSVAAMDSSGSSAQTAQISVTTSNVVVNGNRIYAPYIDLGLGESEQILQIQKQSGIKVFTLAFIVGSGCSPVWGGLNSSLANDVLNNGTTISSLVSGIRAAGGDVIVSNGGAAGQELAQTCSNVGSLQAAYQSVIDKYHLTRIDFDIEGGAVSDQASIDRRNQAVKGLKAANPGLIVSYTLPVLPTGLVDTGINILTSAKRAGLNPDIINVMAMDYGSSNDNNGQMGLDAVLAAQNTLKQVQAAGLTSSIGVTVLIGVNDETTEVFQLADTNQLLNFAQQNSFVTLLSMWSVTRDNGSCAGQTQSLDTCSSIAQNPFQFSMMFEAFH